LEKAQADRRTAFDATVAFPAVISDMRLWLVPTDSFSLLMHDPLLDKFF
jgi:hypothetical protein